MRRSWSTDRQSKHSSEAVEALGEAWSGRIRFRLLGPLAPYDFVASETVGDRSVMGLLTGLLGLPLAPVRGVVWLAEQIRQQAEDQYYDPARIRAQLERIDEARRAGELSEEECAELENELLQRLMTRRR